MTPMAHRMLQFSLAAWFRLILIVAIGLTVIPEEYWPGIAWAGLAFVVALVGAASFFIATVAVYEVFEVGFWLCEACSKLYRRALRVTS